MLCAMWWLYVNEWNPLWNEWSLAAQTKFVWYVKNMWHNDEISHRHKYHSTSETIKYLLSSTNNDSETKAYEKGTKKKKTTVE